MDTLLAANMPELLIKYRDQLSAFVWELSVQN